MNLDKVIGRFLEKIIGVPKVKPPLNNKHFSFDGTLLQAWASQLLAGYDAAPGR